MNINILGPINNLSYGLVTMNLAYELFLESHKIALFPMNEQNIEAHPRFHKSLQEMINNRMLYDYSAPSLKIWHQWDFANSIGMGHRFGFPIFEMNKLTDLEVHHLNSLDKVIVCSEWAKQICLNNGVTSNVLVVPLGCDPQIFNKNPIGLKQDKFIFLNIGKWEIRKGHDVLVEAFNNAFNEQDNVELWMCCENVHSSPEDNKEWADLYLGSKLGSKIRIIPRQETQDQLAYVMKKSSCGIFPARAEGWNLDLLEMMRCGIPCITTNYSGHTAFCNEDNSLLIHADGLETAYDGKWFKPNQPVNQGEWLKFTPKMIEQTIYLMKWAYNNPKQLSDIANKALETTEKFTWKNAAKQLVSVL